MRFINLFIALVVVAVVTKQHICFAASAKPPVVIIGAGVAGAKLAYELSQENVSFIIVEGSDRVGGRLRRQRITRWGPFVELGANWVQGYVRGDPFSEFVTRQVRLRMTETDFDDSYFYRDGKRVSDDEADPVWERVEEAIAEMYRLFNMSYDAEGNILTDTNAESALLAAAGWKGQTPIEIQAMRFDIDYEYAVPASKMSILGLSSFYDPGREERTDMFVNDPRGFRAVVTYLLTKAGISFNRQSRSALRLRDPVKEIMYDPAGGPSQVVLSSGQIIQASAVVSTVPVGVLKQSLLTNPTDPTGIIFTPPLPADKRLAISKFDDADYTKLFIKFRRQVFSSDDPSFLIPLKCEEGSFLNVHNLNKPGYFPGKNMVLLTAVDALSRDLQCMAQSEQLKKALDFVSLIAGRRVLPWEVQSFIIPGWHINRFARGKSSLHSPDSLCLSPFLSFKASVPTFH